MTILRAFFTLTCLALAGCAGGPEPFTASPRPTASFSDIPYASWDETEADYRLYPGDEVEVVVPSAPELNRNVRVGPDGRITLPLTAPIMVADRTLPDLEAALEQAYAPQLRRPDVEVSLKNAPTLKVFVGGEVENPGVYDMPGDIDALQGVLMAGGFTEKARRSQVVVIRRAPGGQAMMRTADLRRAVFAPAGGDAVPLRRFDIVYVPRTSVAEVGIFMQQYVRDALPVQFSYAVNGRVD